MTRFTIRTSNVRDNKHIAAIANVLQDHGHRMTFIYEHRKGEAVGAGYEGSDVPDAVVTDIMALDVPESAKICWG